MLVIHGGPGASSCAYPTTLSDVASTRPVVTYDQLGSGNSDRMPSVERDGVLSRFVDEVVALREELGLDEVHLVGHSWGAAVALEYLLTANPKGVRSVTFVGPLLSTPRWLEDAERLVETLPPDARAAIAAAKSSGKFDTPEFIAANEVFERQFLVRTPPEQWRLPLCDSTPVRFNVALYEHMWGPSELVSTGTLRDYDRIHRQPELRLPAMLLVGEYDEARPNTVTTYQALVPGSVVEVIPGAGHAVNVDAAAEFNVALSRFLRSVEE